MRSGVSGARRAWQTLRPTHLEADGAGSGGREAEAVIIQHPFDVRGHGAGARHGPQGERESVVACDGAAGVH